MSKHNNYFRYNNGPLYKRNQDQEQTQNHANVKKNKTKPFGNPSKSLQPIIEIQSNPLTTYRTPVTQEPKIDRKWKYLVKFQQLASKAHHIQDLKFQTLFLSYSLAEKTVQLVLNQQLTFQYWVVCCLFMSMKYEEIYPPRLKQLSMLVKQVIIPQDYNTSELKILEFIDLDLNFVSLNTYLSEYLHASNEQQRYFIFYFLQIALSLRIQLKNFSLKQLVLSVIFILSSYRLRFYSDQKIDGIPFERIEECSKYIVVCQSSAAEKSFFLFKKYKTQRMKYVSLTSVPTVQNLAALLLRKADKEVSIAKIVGFCEDMPDDKIEQQTDDENDDLLMQILIERANNQMSDQEDNIQD